MALYRVRTKRRKCCNGVNIEPGMEVQVVTPLNNTVQVNNWQYVEDAFMRVFGISLRKANCLNVSDLEYEIVNVRCLFQRLFSINIRKYLFRLFIPEMLRTHSMKHYPEVVALPFRIQLLERLLHFATLGILHICYSYYYCFDIHHFI